MEKTSNQSQEKLWCERGMCRLCPWLIRGSLLPQGMACTFQQHQARALPFSEKTTKTVALKTNWKILRRKESQFDARSILHHFRLNQSPMQNIPAQQYCVARFHCRPVKFLWPKSRPDFFLRQFTRREQGFQPVRDDLEARRFHPAGPKCDPARDHWQQRISRKPSAGVRKEIESKRSVLVPSMG